MDENYLDSLLNEISLDNEIERNVAKTAEQRGELNKDSLNQLVNQDSDNTKLFSEDDIFGESQLDELDALDQMADVDMSELDFSDLDFDDLDMFDTSPKKEKRVKRSVSNTGVQQNTSMEDVPEINLDALSIDDVFFEQSQNGSETEDDLHTLMGAEATQENQSAAITEDIHNLQDVDPGLAASVDNLNADDFLSEFTDFQEDGNTSQSNVDAVSMQENIDVSLMSDTDSFESQDSSGDINELLGMLGIEDDVLSEHENVTEQAAAMGLTENNERQDGFDSDINSFLNDSLTEIDEVIQAKPKRSLAQFLFGAEEDDEPELTEEELQAIQAEKKAKRDAKKAEKKVKTDEKKAAKAAKDAAIQADRAAKKAVKEAERKALLDAAPPDKKLNRKAVVVIMLFFVVVAAVIVVGTNVVNYKIVVQKATDYFQRQKYHMAYDEIAGVEVKEKDKELESKIYTVMYVERLYETYEINAKLKRMDKALDSLLRGLVKYDEHYEEAEELNIVSDINSSRSKIIAALQTDYGLTEEDAYAILELDSYAYRARLAEYAVTLDDDTMISLDPAAVEGSEVK